MGAACVVSTFPPQPKKALPHVFFLNSTFHLPEAYLGYLCDSWGRFNPLSDGVDNSSCTYIEGLNVTCPIISMYGMPWTSAVGQHLFAFSLMRGCVSGIRRCDASLIMVSTHAMHTESRIAQLRIAFGGVSGEQ